MKTKHFALVSTLLLTIAAINLPLNNSRTSAQTSKISQTPKLNLHLGNVTKKKCSLPHPNNIGSTREFMSYASKLKLGQSPSQVVRLIPIRPDGGELIENHDIGWSFYHWSRQYPNSITTHVAANFDKQEELAEVLVTVSKDYDEPEREDCFWKLKL